MRIHWPKSVLVMLFVYAWPFFLLSLYSRQTLMNALSVDCHKLIGKHCELACRERTGVKDLRVEWFFPGLIRLIQDNPADQFDPRTLLGHYSRPLLAGH